MLKVDNLHPSQLDAGVADVWRAMAQSHSVFASPLLGPDFALAVGAVREDARVAVVRRSGDLVGFLPYHRRPGRMARAIGGHLSDRHALVSFPDPDLSIRDVLRAADLGLFRYTALVDPYGVFPASQHTEPTFEIAFDGAASDYLTAVRDSNLGEVRKFQRREAKLARDVGALRLVVPDPSEETFEQILDWKQAQLRRTGAQDFLATGWSRDLLANLFRQRDGALQGLMFGLYAGERLVAGHFGVRHGQAYHMWICSHDPQLGRYSPGQAIFFKLIEAMPSLGITLYDLGAGMGHYKQLYARSQTIVADGAISTGPFSGFLHGMRTASGATGYGLVARLRRRTEQIVNIELTVGGRARGLVDAVTSLPRRGARG